MKNTNACEHCGHKQNPDSGWCYMFRIKPNGPCAQHTIGVAAAMAHRLQVARRMLDSMKPNTEAQRTAVGGPTGAQSWATDER